jgi:very-short-patch-repair endonuclease
MADTAPASSNRPNNLPSEDLRQVAERISASAENWGRKLLDLSRRNKLLNFKAAKVSIVTIVDEQPSDVFRKLFLLGRGMKFRATEANLALAHGNAVESPEADSDRESTLGAGEDGSLNLDFVAYDRASLDQKHPDDTLQTTSEPEALDKSLRRIDEQARLTLEEQGVNTLFLALGMLRYRASSDSDEWYGAPLVLIPVALSRKSARTGFSIRATDDDPITNPALTEYLRNDYGISLPPLPDPSSMSDSFDLQAFLSEVSGAVARELGWAVTPEMYLGLFSFQKFVMYKDLEANRSALGNHRLIQQLITRSGGQFGTLPSGIRDMSLDEEYPPEKTFQVVDADSSQLRAIAAVSRGHDLVLEGPPGTGKSQTITNLIAQALAAGQSVLFVAEKMAALEVVHRRLVEAGLGEFCLEVHSTKANKRSVIASIASALDASLQEVGVLTASAQRIPFVRHTLTEYVTALHTPAFPLGISPYRAYGELGAVYSAPRVAWNGSADAVTRQQLDQTERDLRELAAVAAPILSVANHPFFSATKTFYTEADVGSIRQDALSVVKELEHFEDLLREVQDRFGLPGIERLADLSNVELIREIVAASPGAPDSVLVDAEWNTLAGKANLLVEDGRRLSRQVSRIKQLFDDAVFEHSHAADILFVEQKGSGILGFLANLNAPYRTIKRSWTGYRRGFVGKMVDEANELRRVDEIRAERQELHEHETEAKNLFGTLWNGEQSDWNNLEQYIVWVSKYRAAALQLHLSPKTAMVAANPRPDVSSIDRLIASGKLLIGELEKLEEVVGWPSGFLYGFAFSEVGDRASRLGHEAELAPQWGYFENVRARVNAGLAKDLLQCALGGEVRFDQLPSSFLRAFLQAWLARVVLERPPLRDFHSLTHEQRIKEFRELDANVLRENRAALVRQLRNQIQSGLQAPEAARGMPYLQRQMAKQRGLAPLRVTMKNAEAAIRAIKPCLMMSPLTVAQLLRGDKPTFDLVVFDEASQLPSEDAVGAIIRGERLVVVGDPKQLPPTNFFSVVSLGDGESLGDDGLPLYTDSESVLEEYLGAGLPTSRLKWHYRSAHESLITFSNVSFYESDLYTFPSVETGTTAEGLQFEYIPGATYEGKGLNQVEARRVADEIVRFAREQLERSGAGEVPLSLGVGTFNLRQQLAIQDELEQRRRDNPEIEAFFDRGVAEPFFVKNLENIQGDERDVIFISVTFAKGSDGKLRYNFGPLNGQNGWRRLNVLVTRARRVMRVFSSMHGEEISPATSSSDGPRLLREFLIYAEHGRLDSTIASRLADAESPFEQDVIQELTHANVTVVPQVGFAGYRIDMAVVDDELSGKFLCGIECDGVAYHESETARDRDRLRQQVLEARGWTIHRVWSTDWFKDRSGQIRRLLGLINADRVRAKGEAEERAVRDLALAEATRVDAEKSEAARRKQNGSVTGVTSTSQYIRPIGETYKATVVEPSRRGHDLLIAPESEIADAIALVVSSESPIHRRDLSARVAAMWGKRTGRRILDRISSTCRTLERGGSIERKGDFYWNPGSTCLVRSRAGTRIPPNRIAPEEYQAAILRVLEKGHGFTRPQLLTEIRSIFGFGKINTDMELAVERSISDLLSIGRLGEGSTGIRLRNSQS